jgi:flavin reductase (DIM6/NTAB) family NADH-FMN oxidoreductase RutF
MVEESPIRFEYTSYTTVRLSRNHLIGSVIGKILVFHISDKVLTDGIVDLSKVQPIALYLRYCALHL